ncbi:MAG: ISNCY family transposase [Gammaproteobacteria bacterium]|nr:ISNCY family transposase [Gammaproteobacteria bacterium]
MKQKSQPQMNIWEFYSDHPISDELQVVSTTLDLHPEFLVWIAKDLCPKNAKQTGRQGLTVDTVLRTAILKQHKGFTYEELEFHLGDSDTFRAFTRVGGQKPSASALQANIKGIKSTTWEKINRCLLQSAVIDNIEKGRVIRTDSTVVETNIHPPTDSSLLWDVARVLTRMLHEAKEIEGMPAFSFQDHTRACKKRSQRLDYMRKEIAIKKAYKELITYTKKIAAYALALVIMIDKAGLKDPMVVLWKQEAEDLLTLANQVVDQATRRVLKDEKVPASEKILSIFEPHTDVIKRGARPSEFGHKVNLTTGKSGLVLDFVIEKGNPADSTRTLPMIERQKKIYGRLPRQACFDGSYASRPNLEEAKQTGIKDVAFHKKNMLKVADMTKSNWVYRKLVKFRAGIEGNISCLKRAFGLYRCTWKSLEGFKSYAWCSVVAYNLITLARLST